MKKLNKEKSLSFTKIQLFFVIFLGLALGIRQMAMTMVMPFISVYSQTLSSYTPLLAGLALGMFGLTQAIFQIPFGILSDRYGKKKMMLIGLFQVSIGLVIAYFSTSIYTLIFARALQGSGAIIAVAYAWVSIEVEEEKRTKAMGILSMIVGASAAISFAIGPMIHKFVEVNQMFIYCTIIVFISFLCILLFLKENKDSKTDNPNNTIEVSELSKSITSKDAIKLLLKNKNFISLNSLAFFNNFIMTAVFYIIPQYLVNITTIDGMWKIFLPSVVIAIILMKVFISKDNEEKETPMLIISFLLCTIGTSLFLKPTFIFILIGTMMFMTGYIFIMTIVPSKANRLTENSYRGTSNGILNSFQYIGSFIGSLLTGALWGISHIVAVIFTIAICACSTIYAKKKLTV